MRELDPSASPLAFFGAELRRARLAADKTQEQLARTINYSAALVGQVETATKVPPPDLAELCDKALGTDGYLGRLWAHLIGREVYPAWFRPFPEIEARASTIRSWEPSIVPGLLQTEDYARELFQANPGITEEQIQDSLTARLERQSILDRDDPPLVWALMDESVLYRQVGSPKVMYDQLQALLDAASRSNVALQIVPLSSGAQPGVNGAFAIAAINGSQDAVYLESAGEGRVTDRAEDVAAITNIYDAIRAEALPVRASLDLIREAMKRWT